MAVLTYAVKTNSSNFLRREERKKKALNQERFSAFFKREIYYNGLAKLRLKRFRTFCELFK
jgi:hypothetical protein